VLGTTPEFWLNLQASYDLEEALKKLKTILPKLTDLTQTSDAHFAMAG
jgi:plasmid maintenance system antidote protein VapI